MTFNFRTIGIGILFLIVGALTDAAELPLKGESQIKFEYELTRKDAQKLESEVAGLTKGSSLDAVKSLLGKPDAERTLHTKQFFGGGRFVAKEITYVLERVHIGNDNVNDHVINLYFDKNNMLTEAERLGYSITGTYEILGGVQIREKIL